MIMTIVSARTCASLSLISSLAIVVEMCCGVNPYTNQPRPSRLVVSELQLLEATEYIMTIFCGNSVYLYECGNNCKSGLPPIINPYSSINHVLVISIDILVQFYCSSVHLGTKSMQKPLLMHSTNLDKGKEKVLEDKNIPKLRQVDRVETCYFVLKEKLSKEKEKGTLNPSVLITIFLWQLKSILVSGFFALIKVLTLATGPLFLRAFILVAEGKETFKYEGYAPTAGLFLGKRFESLSERQWSFRTRLIGPQIRSLLTAAIYQKQLKLSNAAKINHSPGQITNYVMVDSSDMDNRPSDLPSIFYRRLRYGDCNYCRAFRILQEPITMIPDVGAVFIEAKVRVYREIAYVSQAAWIQMGTMQENILFGCTMDQNRYEEVLEKCSLKKDLEMLPFADCTIIGEWGVNLSGGQKQWVQLARALYKDVDIYLLDDPFSDVDAHTATSLFNEYVIGALVRKTVLLVTHQVDFLPAFDSISLVSEGKIVEAAIYDQLLASSQQFQNLVNAHKSLWLDQESSVSRLELISAYSLIGSVFRAPISFYDSTPLGRILSRVSSDMSIVDLELAFIFTLSMGNTMNAYFSFGVLASLTWPILFVILPMVIVTIILQSTTKSSVATHLAESIAGAVTIRAFGEEDRFFSENLQLIDANASSFFHKFSADEWLCQCLEILCAIVLSCSELGMTFLFNDTSKSDHKSILLIVFIAFATCII
ncbi:hypothetical protein RHSIM_Rhsim02G0137200 [Rhododendron simsii]|uniref:Uncharacterized protein n=1 Tax=Rhododendron simsii TaxID=118357 RepID=A0A834LRI6_RHOSS|nr:hypothetical protein RHSIM_Rhsim02G0137200 [Rhododendron simsii]